MKRFTSVCLSIGLFTFTVLGLPFFQSPVTIKGDMSKFLASYFHEGLSGERLNLSERNGRVGDSKEFIRPSGATVAWTGGVTPWYTSTNWTPNRGATQWLTDDIAQFNNAGSASRAGINMSTAPLSIGAIEVTSLRDRPMLIGNSSSTPGTLTLNGTLVNSVSNVVVRNASGSILTLQNNDTGTGKIMNIALGNAVENIFSLDGEGDITISSIITGTSKNLTLAGSGAGILNLSGANIYSGNTTIRHGVLSLVGGASIAQSPTIEIGGGATFDVQSLTNPLVMSAGQTLRASGSTTTGFVATGSVVKGLTTSASSPILFSDFNGTVPPLTVQGTAFIALQASNPVTVTVANGSNPLGPGVYKLIAKSGSATVTGTPSSVVVNGIQAGSTASLENIGGELFLRITAGSTVPEITVTPTSHNFGNIPVNTVALDDFVATITNTGTADLDIGPVTVTGANAGDFTVVGDPSNTPIAPTGSLPLQVSFTPSASGTRSAQINISSNDADEPNTVITVSGNGIQPGNLSFSSVSYTVNESGPTATVTVNRVEGSDGTVMVSYQAGSGGGTLQGVRKNGIAFNATGGALCSTQGVDFVSVNGTLTFGPGVTSQTFDVPICDDALYEGLEGAPLSLLSPSGGSGLGLASSQFSIIDNDPQPTLSVNNISMNEGDVGFTDFSFTVTQSAVSGLQTSFNCSGDPGSAQIPSDFLNNGGPRQIPAGDTTVSVTFQVVGDTVFEPDEFFQVQCGSPSNATFTDGTGRADIINDDPAPPSLSIGDVSIVEGNSGQSTFVFTVTKTGTSVDGSSFDFATADGTATDADNDYGPTSGTVNFTAAETSKTISVTVNGDTNVEPDETFVINLTNPVNAAISDNQAIGTITNDDNSGFIVNDNGDAVDDLPGDGTCATAGGVCTLRAAIGEANALAGTETITFAPGITNIQIQLNYIISSPMNIVGPGANVLTIDNVGPTTFDSRLFYIPGASAVEISGLKMTGGNVSSSAGGAMYIDSSNVILNNVWVTDCVVASGEGAGIVNLYGTTTILDSLISGNTVNNASGGNTGSAIVNFRGTVNITNTTISGNTTNVLGYGSAVYNFGADLPSTINISGSTITNNHSTGGFSTGGVANVSGYTVTVQNSIIAGNTTTDIHPDVIGAFFSNGYNIIGDVSEATGFTHPTDQVGPVSPPFNAAGAGIPLDPMLKPLANNGGPVMTHALMVSALSPAIDKGNSFGALFDARGFPRIYNFSSIPDASDGADIGAFEVQAPTAALVSISGRISSANGQAIRNVVVTVSGGNLGSPRTVVTGTFGYYRFDGIVAGETYFIGVSAKRYTFATPTVAVNATDNLSELNFTALQ